MAGKKREKPWILQGGIVLLYEDRDILVIDKPPGLLTAGTEKERSRTAYAILSDFVKSIRKGSKVFLVHRLDRETSGLLVFAKSEEAKFKLQNSWDSVQKRYLAIVHGTPEEKEALLTDSLAEAGSHRVYVTDHEEEGKISKTRYRVLKSTKKFALLDVELLTGRKHQIRVQLAHAGHPILGDRKYGIEDAYKKRLALHALSLEFPHPSTGKMMKFETIVPPYFSTIVGQL